MFLNSFIQMLPILIIAAGGYLTKKAFAVETQPLVKITADFFMPMLVFHALYHSDLHGSQMLGIAGAVTVVIAAQTAISYFYARTAKIDYRGFMPANIFLNSGFLGIPLMKLWGGLAAMNLIVVFEQVQTMYLFTLGLLIITGGFSRRSLGHMVKAPILWAIVAGFAFNLLQLPVPRPLLTTFEFGGNAAPPFAAYILGCSLFDGRLRIDRHVLAGILIRIVGGFFLGLLAAALFGMGGLERTVIVVAAALPSAVFTSVLPMRYGVPSEYAGPIVVLSTLISIITIPLTFMLVG